MSPKEIAIAFTMGIFNDKDYSFIYRYLDKDVVIHSLIGDFKGQRSMEEVLTQWSEGFPDLSVTILHAVCEDGHAMVHWKSNGTHKGIFKGIPPTNKKVAFSGAIYFHIQNEKIIEYAAFLDMQHLLNQLKS